MGPSVQPTQWWQAIDRRTFGKGALAFATLAGMSGCKGEEELNNDSLALQRQHGWNLGAEESRLFLRYTAPHDATGATDWTRYPDPTRRRDAWRPQVLSPNSRPLRY